ncbi:N-acyl homoserine lactonase family protein [Neobacillus niacini]|uniref:N-acyl homoserine lactonase family protein n=1 Tax=Neobacillus niacini TaxID=86668 RepID=UPI003003221F
MTNVTNTSNKYTTNMATKARPKVYVLDNGVITADENWFFSMNNPAVPGQPYEPKFMRMPIFTVLIDHPEGKILFDTACNPDSMSPGGRWDPFTQALFPWHAKEEDYLHNRLEQLNVRPDDIKYVVASHLHLDHVGCLDMFKKSTIICHDDEFTAAMKSYGLNHRAGGPYFWNDTDAWLKANLQWDLIKRDEDYIELVEGVRILNFGSGHTMGMLCLELDLPETGKVILGSDLAYSKESVGPPARVPVLVHDTVGYVNATERIRRLPKSTQVWYSHDSENFEKLVKSTEGYYE